MIYGIGTDIVEISRIGQSIDRFGDKFINRIFTKHEQTAAQKRKDQTRFYAMRFAAKEACWKALSPGRDFGIGWLDLEVITLMKAPVLLHSKAAEFVAGKPIAKANVICLKR